MNTAKRIFGDPSPELIKRRIDAALQQVKLEQERSAPHRCSVCLSTLTYDANSGMWLPPYDYRIGHGCRTYLHEKRFVSCKPELGLGRNYDTQPFPPPPIKVHHVIKTKKGCVPVETIDGVIVEAGNTLMQWIGKPLSELNNEI